MSVENDEKRKKDTSLKVIKKKQLGWVIKEVIE